MRVSNIGFDSAPTLPEILQTKICEALTSGYARTFADQAMERNEAICFK